MYIIAGLGNPGKKYENTRHNMGFLAVDLLAEKYGIRIDKIKFKALVGEETDSAQAHHIYESQRTIHRGGNEFLQGGDRKSDRHL